MSLAESSDIQMGVSWPLPRLGSSTNSTHASSHRRVCELMLRNDTLPTPEYTSLWASEPRPAKPRRSKP